MLVLAGIAVVSAIGVVIIAVNAPPSARSSERRTPVSSSTSTTLPPFVDDGTLTAPRIYRGGLIELVPPPIGTRPRVTASEAFANRGGYAWRKEPPEPHLVLAVATLSDYVTNQSDGTDTPFIDRRLAWVVMYSDVPADDIPRAENPSPARVTRLPATTTPRPAKTSSGYTVLSFVDASTGKALGASGFANQPPSAKCAPARIVGKSYLSPSGEKSSRPSPGAATIYEFADGNQQLVVPERFDPLRAGALTLFLFGFPARPDDPAARRQWEDTFRHYPGSARVGEGYCVGATATSRTTKHSGT